MSIRLQVQHPVYPLIGIISSVIIIVCGLLTAKRQYCIVFLAAVWLLFLCFGYWKACIAVLPVAFVFCAVLGGFTFAISHSWQQSVYACCRILALCIGVIPGLAMHPASMVRCFASLKVPRTITLAMMITFSFFPLLASEVKRIREAMKTRGAGGLANPRVFYRALLIPLMMRLINISDTLALSVETRGFSAGGDYTVYKTIRLMAADILFAILLVGLCLAVLIIR